MRRLLPIALAALAAAALAVIAPSGVDAQVIESATLDVTKVVEGDVPPGTTFTVEVVCPFIDGPPTDSTAVDSEEWGGVPEGAGGDIEETLTFGEEGGTQTVEDIGFLNRNCTVTETEDGGAESVTATGGADNSGACDVTPGTTTAEIEFGGPTTCEVVVTNTFPTEPEPEPAPAAAAVTVGPTFTG